MLYTEAADFSACGGVVEEHSVLIEGRLRNRLDGTEEIMPERVAIKQARNLLTESLRFPGEG